MTVVTTGEHCQAAWIAFYLWDGVTIRTGFSNWRLPCGATEGEPSCRVGGAPLTQSMQLPLQAAVAGADMDFLLAI